MILVAKWKLSQSGLDDQGEFREARINESVYDKGGEYGGIVAAMSRILEKLSEQVVNEAKRK